MKKITHIGNEIGIVYNRGMFRQVQLRETKKYWINEYGIRYCKNDGSIAGERFATFKLEIESIKEII